MSELAEFFEAAIPIVHISTKCNVGERRKNVFQAVVSQGFGKTSRIPHINTIINF